MQYYSGRPLTPSNSNFTDMFYPSMWLTSSISNASPETYGTREYQTTPFFSPLEFKIGASSLTVSNN